MTLGATSLLALSGCSAPTTHNDASAPSIHASQLPAGAFPNRLNPGNNGTSYEPCTTQNERAVTNLGWDWSSRREAATVDKQTARGCAWKDSKRESLWGLQQIVGNSPSLAAFKASNNAFQWFPDELIDSRQVAVFGMSRGTCVARVQSQRAGVSTIVDNFEVPSPPLSEICDRAIAFTKATISRMPV